MKVKHSYTGELQASDTLFHFSVSLKNKLNLLILAHLLLYSTYLILGWSARWYRKVRFCLNDRIQPAFWQIYAVVVLLSFFLVCKNNMAYILVYAAGIYLGARYASGLEVDTAQ